MMKWCGGLLLALFAVSVFAGVGPKPEYWSFWDRAAENNFGHIDQSDWNSILKTYVVTQHSSGINRFRYADVSKEDRKRLSAYIRSVTKIDPREYRRDEQKAYWLNLYNALAVQLVLDHYPVDSIQNIGGKGSAGPWGEKLVTVADEKLSMNDIEHRILRPIWQDHKIHFGLACASLGCPSLLPEAFTAANVNDLLRGAGRDFINSRRGVLLENGKLKASQMFSWYQEDFAKSETSLLKVFAHYADDRQALYLLGFSGKIDYGYDWRLNAP